MYFTKDESLLALNIFIDLIDEGVLGCERCIKLDSSIGKMRILLWNSIQILY